MAGTANNRRQNARQRRRGSNLVEFALLLPVLLAIVIGIMEFGWMEKNYLQVANATREGARAAALGKSTSDIQGRITNQCAPISVASPDGSITMSYSSDGGTTYNAWPADFNGKNGVTAGQLVKITTTTKFKPLTGFFPFFKNRNLTAIVIMRREP